VGCWEEGEEGWEEGEEGWEEGDVHFRLIWLTWLRNEIGNVTQNRQEGKENQWMSRLFRGRKTRRKQT
jgi:hypothetical protein